MIRLAQNSDLAPSSEQLEVSGRLVSLARAKNHLKRKRISVSDEDFHEETPVPDELQMRSLPAQPKDLPEHYSIQIVFANTEICAELFWSACFATKQQHALHKDALDMFSILHIYAGDESCHTDRMKDSEPRLLEWSLTGDHIQLFRKFCSLIFRPDRLETGQRSECDVRNHISAIFLHYFVFFMFCLRGSPGWDMREDRTHLLQCSLAWLRKDALPSEPLRIIMLNIKNALNFSEMPQRMMAVLRARLRSKIVWRWDVVTCPTASGNNAGQQAPRKSCMGWWHREIHITGAYGQSVCLGLAPLSTNLPATLCAASSEHM